MIKLTDEYYIEADDSPPRYALCETGGKVISYHATLEGAVGWLPNVIGAKKLKEISCLSLDDALAQIIELRQEIINVVKENCI